MEVFSSNENIVDRETRLGEIGHFGEKIISNLFKKD
jgi:hypothetical protein